MENIYTIINTLNKVSNESVMESDKETNAKDPMQETPFSSDSVTKLLDAEQQIAGIKSELKNSMMSRLAELAGVPLAEIEEAIGETPEAAAARIKEGHCEACGCEMANPDPTCECGASGGKIMVTMDEDEVEEGNEFSGALAQAKKDGKEEFEVDGKKYKVSEAEIEEGKMSDLHQHIGEMIADGASNEEIKKMHPMVKDSDIDSIRREMDESVQFEEVQEVDEVAESIAKMAAMAGVGSKFKSNHGIHEGEEGYQLTPRSIVAREMRKLQDIERGSK